jgi:hypothetical protein
MVAIISSSETGVLRSETADDVAPELSNNREKEFRQDTTSRLNMEGYSAAKLAKKYNIPLETADHIPDPTTIFDRYVAKIDGHSRHRVYACSLSKVCWPHFSGL